MRPTTKLLCSIACAGALLTPIRASALVTNGSFAYDVSLSRGPAAIAVGRISFSFDQEVGAPAPDGTLSGTLLFGDGAPVVYGIELTPTRNTGGS